MALTKNQSIAGVGNRFKLAQNGNSIFVASIMALKFAPGPYKLPALAILYFTLIAAAIIDWRKSSKRVRRITRRVASCSCVRARETISHIHMPKILKINCTICGAEAS